jgi:Bacterial archaeo-eukaryotic release factor family 3
MTPQKIATPEVVTIDDLKELASANGPCITLAVDIPDPLQIRTRMKNSIRGLEKRLHYAGVDTSTAGTLMEPIQALAASIEDQRQWGSDLVLFRSPEIFRYYMVPELTREFVEVGPRFQIRPLLSIIALEQRFYLLALSQKHVRLLRATHHSVEEVPLHGRAPENLEAWMHARTPDHVLDNRSTGGPSTGSMKGVMFGTSTDLERRNEYLAHFFSAIDSGIRGILSSGDTPLILAGVTSETALYARENTYSRLLEETVPGSPEKLSAGELHQHGLTIVRRTFTPLLTKALQDMKKQQGTPRTASGAEAVLKAINEGRVADLFFPEDEEQRGTWDEAAQQIRPGDEDLLNLAAVQTLSYNGHAFALKRSDMPEPAGVAALLRF